MLIKPLAKLYVGAFLTKKLGHVHYELHNQFGCYMVEQTDLSGQWFIVISRTLDGGPGDMDVVQVLTSHGFRWLRSSFLDSKNLDRAFPA